MLAISREIYAIYAIGVLSEDFRNTKRAKYVVCQLHCANCGHVCVGSFKNFNGRGQPGFAVEYLRYLGVVVSLKFSRWRRGKKQFRRFAERPRSTGIYVSSLLIKFLFIMCRLTSFSRGGFKPARRSPQPYSTAIFLGGPFVLYSVAGLPTCPYTF